MIPLSCEEVRKFHEESASPKKGDRRGGRGGDRTLDFELCRSSDLAAVLFHFRPLTYFAAGFFLPPRQVLGPVHNYRFTILPSFLFRGNRLEAAKTQFQILSLKMKHFAIITLHFTKLFGSECDTYIAISIYLKLFSRAVDY